MTVSPIIAPSPYDRVLEDLSREAQSLEYQIREAQARLTKLRPIINGLKELALDARTVPVPPPVFPAQDPAQVALALPEAPTSGPLERSNVPVAPHKRGDTTKLVIATLSKTPGLSLQELTAAIYDKITSQAGNKKKLVSNVVANLIDKDRVEKVGGRLTLIVRT